MIYKAAITGKEARKEGFYEGPEFILEHAEKYYDAGIWLIPTDGGYALWFTDCLNMANYLAER